MGRGDTAPLIPNLGTGCEWSNSPSGHCSNTRNFVSIQSRATQLIHNIAQCSVATSSVKCVMG